MPALLALSADRITQELRHYEELNAAEAVWRRAWRRRVLWLTVRCALTYVLGGVLAWGSLAMSGDVAQIAFWGGLLLSNAGPMAFGYAFWMRENGSWAS
jgi:hypothetical protein